MPNHSTDWLSRYQPWRKILEPGFWIGFFFLQAALNSSVVMLDLQRMGAAVPSWAPAVWEWSSNVVVLALVPAVIRFERRFPIRWEGLLRNSGFNVLGSIGFCLLHVSLMVALRKLAYATQGQSYHFGLWWRELGYEYLKDFRTYFAIVGTVRFYQLLLLSWQGEASLLVAPETGTAVEPVERPERFLVRKLGKDFLLPATDIDYVQAWGNYVNLRVRGHDYPLRSTMAALEKRLDPNRFVRVHRSYIVNLQSIREIVPLESGDARAVLRENQEVAVSRRYREALRGAVLAVDSQNTP